MEKKRENSREITGDELMLMILLDKLRLVAIVEAVTVGAMFALLLLK